MDRSNQLSEITQKKQRTNSPFLPSQPSPRQLAAAAAFLNPDHFLITDDQI